MMSPWYGSSRMLVVGPAAVTRQPLAAFLHDHRTAVIEDRAAQIDRRLVLHQVRVDRVAAGEHAAGDHHDVADLERAHVGLAERRAQRDFLAGAREARPDRASG